MEKFVREAGGGRRRREEFVRRGEGKGEDGATKVGRCWERSVEEGARASALNPAGRR